MDDINKETNMPNRQFFKFSPVSPEAVLFNLLSPKAQYEVRGKVFKMFRRIYRAKAPYRLENRARIVFQKPEAKGVFK